MSHPSKNGIVLAWGCNDHGQLGLENHEYQKQFKVITKLRGLRVKSVYAKSNSSFAVLENGRVFVWGEDHQPYPQKASGIAPPHEIYSDKSKYFHSMRIKSVATCKSHTIAVVEDNLGACHVYSWGENDYGQLGLGYYSHQKHTAPEKIDTLSDLGDMRVKSVAVGGYQSYAVMEDGRVFQWGEIVASNGHYQCGSVFSDTINCSPRPLWCHSEMKARYCVIINIKYPNSPLIRSLYRYLFYITSRDKQYKTLQFYIAYSKDEKIAAAKGLLHVIHGRAKTETLRQYLGNSNRPGPLKTGRLGKIYDFFLWLQNAKAKVKPGKYGLLPYDDMYTL